MSVDSRTLRRNGLWDPGLVLRQEEDTGGNTCPGPIGGRWVRGTGAVLYLCNFFHNVVPNYRVYLKYLRA